MLDPSPITIRGLIRAITGADEATSVAIEREMKLRRQSPEALPALHFANLAIQCSRFVERTREPKP